MLEKTRKALRIKNDKFDDEVNLLIEAGKSDLSISGIKPDVTEPEIELMIIIYAKAHFGVDNRDSEKFLNLYNEMKKHLSLTDKHKI